LKQTTGHGPLKNSGDIENKLVGDFQKRLSVKGQKYLLYFVSFADSVNCFNETDTEHILRGYHTCFKNVIDQYPLVKDAWGAAKVEINRIIDKTKIKKFPRYFSPLTKIGVYKHSGMHLGYLLIGPFR
jgi:hypothetical protein